jgi:hypothetical protein
MHQQFADRAATAAVQKHAPAPASSIQRQYRLRWDLVVAVFLFSPSCVVKHEPELCQPRYEQGPCRLRYSPFDGYYRACERIKVGETCPWDDTDLGSNASRPPREATPETPPTSQPPTATTETSPLRPERPAPLPLRDGGSPTTETPAANVPVTIDAGTATEPVQRDTPFDIPCIRDNQCGSGSCVNGLCFYGCSTDENCGSGDRCSVETGRRICSPDPSPPLECSRSSDCGEGLVCLNAACRQACTITADCNNLLDRCRDGICEADRRPIAQCVLSSECAPGQSCLDGSCVNRCPDLTCDAGG